jgi:hypothetical protein
MAVTARPAFDPARDLHAEALRDLAAQRRHTDELAVVAIAFEGFLILLALSAAVVRLAG